MAGVQTTLAWDTYRQISISEVGTGTVINGQLDGAVRDPRTEDYTGAVNFTLARYLKPQWRVETSYQYRYRSDWDVALTTPSLQTIIPTVLPGTLLWVLVAPSRDLPDVSGTCSFATAT